MTAATETAPQKAAPTRWFRRAWEWLWRGQALRQARAARAASANRLADERARIAAEVAEQILTPSTPWFAGKAHQLAAALFVEALGWALRAMPRPHDADAVSPGSFEGPAGNVELEQLLQQHEAALLSVAPGRMQLERLRGWALKRTFESTSCPADEVEVAAHTLAGVARRLLQLNQQAQPRTDRVVLQQRLVRSGGLALLAVLAVVVRPIVQVWQEPRQDLAAGKPWQASSIAPEPACQSPAQSCAAGKDFFFHTQEEQNPWFELDLTAPRQFSSVRVINRQDCCGERAVPLVVEVSNDHKTWRQVAQQNETFDSWRPRFKTQSARWVRLRVARRSFLHLYEVRVLP